MTAARPLRRTRWRARTAAALALAGALGLSEPAAAQVSVLGLKNQLVQFLLEQIGTPGAFEITADRVTEPAEGVTALEGVAVSDGEGVWMTAAEIAFDWTPSALLAGRVEIGRLTITDLDVARTPGSANLEGGALNDADPAPPFAWPRAPIALRVDAFELRDVFIADGVFSHAIRFDGDGAVRDEGDAQRLQLTLTRRDAIAGQIAISYDRRFQADTLALRIDGAEAPGGVIAALAGVPDDSASRLDLTAAGPPSDWRLDFTAEVDHVFAATGRAAVAYQGPVSADADFSLTPGARLSPALRRALAPSAGITARVAEDADGVVSLSEARIEAADLTVSLSGTYDRNDGALNAAWDGVAESGLSDLIPNVTFRRATLSGRVSGPPEARRAQGAATLSGFAGPSVAADMAELSADLVWAGADLDFNLEGRTDGLSAGGIEASALGAVSVTASGALKSDVLTLREASARSDAGDAAASGTMDFASDAIDLRFEAALPQLAPWMAAAGVDGSGSADATGALSGATRALSLRADARFRDVVAAGLEFGGGAASADLGLGTAISGPLDLRLTDGRLAPARAALRLSSVDNQIRLDALEIDLLGASARGALDIDLRAGPDGAALAAGRIAAAAPDLARVGAAVGLDLRGAGRADVELSRMAGRQAVTASVQLDRATVDSQRFLTANARLAAADVQAGTGIEADIDAEWVQRGGAQLAAGSVRASGAIDALNVEIEAEGGAALPFKAGAASRLSVSSTETVLRLNRLEARFPALPEQGVPEDKARLSAPATLRWGAAGVEIDQVAAALPRGGEVVASGALFTTGDIQADTALTGLDLAFLSDRFAAPAEAGTLAATVALDTRPGRSQGAADITVEGLVSGDVGRGAAPLAVVASGRWDGTRADANLSASGAFQSPLRAAVSLPMRISAGKVSVPANGALNGSASWRGDVAELWALAPAPAHLLSGDAQLALALRGTVGAPSVSGDVTLQNGRYENLTLGTILTDLSISSQLSDAETATLDVAATAGDGGRLTGAAALNLAALNRADAAGRPIDITLRLDRARIAQRDAVTVTASGDLAIEGGPTALNVSGQIVIDEAELRLVNALPPDIPDLGAVTVEGALPHPPSPTREPSAATQLDVTLSAPQRVFTRGRGLDAEWRADLTVTGAAAAPRVTGSVTALRGGLDLLGRRFALTQGDVLFRGGDPIDPSLDIVFTRAAEDLEGRIELSGTASELKLGFAARPALPEEEVLPRVLFGRSKQSLTATEAFQLASGVATLVSGEAGLLDRVRAATGVDVLQVDETAIGGSAVTAGRYVGDGVFVGATQSFDGTGGGALIELDVIDGLKLEAEVGPSSGSSVGAKWEYDF